MERKSGLAGRGGIANEAVGGALGHERICELCDGSIAKGEDKAVGVEAGFGAGQGRLQSSAAVAPTGEHMFGHETRSQLREAFAKGEISGDPNKIAADHRVGGDERDVMAVFGQFPRSATTAPTACFVKHNHARAKAGSAGEDVFDGPDVAPVDAGQSGNMGERFLEPLAFGQAACGDDDFIDGKSCDVFGFDIGVQFHFDAEFGELGFIPSEQVKDLAAAAAFYYRLISTMPAQPD